MYLNLLLFHILSTSSLSFLAPLWSFNSGHKSDFNNQTVMFYFSSSVFKMSTWVIFQNTSRGDNWNATVLLLIFSPVPSLKQYNNFSQQLMEAHSFICPALMYIHSTAKRDNQHRLLYFLWIPGSSGKTFVFNAPTSSQDPWVGLVASCLLTVKLFEMKVNSPCFNSLSK